MGPDKAAVGWPWRFFIFSFLIALTAAAIYVGLAFGYKSFLQSRSQKLDDDIETLANAIPKDQQEKMLRFYSQLANLQTLLNKHTTPSALFTLLEHVTNQQVILNGLEIKLSERRILLEGTAASYQVFAQQLEAFNRVPEVERVLVNESYASDGRVIFRISVIVRESALRKQ